MKPGDFSIRVQQRDSRKSSELPRMIYEGTQLQTGRVYIRLGVFSQLSRPVRLGLLKTLRTCPAKRVGDFAWSRNIRGSWGAEHSGGTRQEEV